MVKTYPGTDTIEDDIRATRQSIDDKVERIQQRLSPGDIVDSVVDFARTNGGAIASGIGRGVRDNPLPVAMIGAGIVWFVLSSRAQHRHDTYVEYSDDGDSISERLSQRAAAVRDDVRERASDVWEQAEEIGHKARVQAVRAGRTSGRFVKDHPILFGAAGIALGAAVAAALPRTSVENDTFGERAERTKQAAKRAALKEGRKVQEAAKLAVEKAREAAERKAPDAGDVKRDAESIAKAATGAKASPGATG